MSVGGTVVDIVKVRDDKWWIDTVARADLMHGGRTCAVYCDPKGEPIEVGDSLWWQCGWCYWTPRDRERVDVKLPKIGFSGVPHPERAAHGRGRRAGRCRLEHVDETDVRLVSLRRDRHA